MTEQKARENGLLYTGYYERDPERINIRIIELRKKYPDCKFYSVTIPDNPLSRSCCISKGYSIYATELYGVLYALEKFSTIHVIHNNALEYLQKEYQKKVDEENIRYENNLNLVKEYKENEKTLRKQMKENK